MGIEIPREWREVLTQLKIGGFPEACIVGGALRDLTFGKPIKDVDIFVTARDGMEEEIDDALGVTTSVIVGQASAEYMNEGLAGVAGIYAFTLLGTEYQVIALATQVPVGEFAMLAMDRVDFGLCRIAYDGNATLYAPEFVEDAKAKVFKVRRSENVQQYARTVARYERLVEKYPGFTFDVASELRELLFEPSAA